MRIGFVPLESRCQWQAKKTGLVLIPHFVAICRKMSAVFVFNLEGLEERGRPVFTC
jgi:hypothetical protein